jgi:hypothetical protein
LTEARKSGPLELIGGRSAPASRLRAAFAFLEPHKIRALLLPRSPGYEPGGDIIRQWDKERTTAALAGTRLAIKAALARGDMDRAMLLVGKAVGLSICLSLPQPAVANSTAGTSPIAN